jgi:hypothetical protein
MQSHKAAITDPEPHVGRGIGGCCGSTLGAVIAAVITPPALFIGAMLFLFLTPHTPSDDLASGIGYALIPIVMILMPIGFVLGGVIGGIVGAVAAFIAAWRSGIPASMRPWGAIGASSLFSVLVGIGIGGFLGIGLPVLAAMYGQWFELTSR